MMGYVDEAIPSQGRDKLAVYPLPVFMLAKTDGL